MKALILGAGPIGRWLALRLHPAGTDVTLLARNETLRVLEQRGIDVGGPETLGWAQVAAVAFEVLDRPVKLTRVPAWLMWAVVRFVRLFDRYQGELLAFFTTMATTDMVAPSTGSHTLEAHFRDLVAGS